MRNLKPVHHQLLPFCTSSFRDEVVSCTSTDTDTIFGITREGILFELDVQSGTIKRTFNINENVEGVTPDAKMMDIQYVAELESLIIISQFDIITFNISTDMCEVTASIEEGILAMSWSPDQEIVIFATGNGNILTMSKHFETLTEAPSDLIPTKTNTSTNTAGTTPKQPAKLTEEVSARFLNRQSPVNISWRNDGQYFVVNTMDSSDGKRWLRVWERNGNLVSKSEPVDGLLGQVVHYRPDGSIIGTHQYHAGKKETSISFFERNGLQHYDFLLEKGMSDVYSLEWNTSSDVLCVSFKPALRENVVVVQLWYRENYHWYLKQEYTFNEEKQAPTYVAWDIESSYRLHIFCKDGSYICYDLCWDHDMTSGMTNENPCVMAVIDGNKVNLTPLRYAVVPPPMCSDSISFDLPVNSVTFGGSQRCLVLLSDNSLHMFEFSHNNKPPKFGLPPKKVGILQHTPNTSIRLLTMINRETFCYVLQSIPGKTDSLIICSIKEDLSVDVREVSYPESIIRVSYHDYSGNLFVEGETGALFKQKLSDDIPEELNEKFEHPCQIMAPTMMGEEEVVVGLNSRGILFIGSHNVVSNCSSFTLTDQFLLFTTMSHKLRIINLNLSLYDAVDIAASGPTSKYDETFREIERGARLVCAVPADLNVILQMPRGNLEGITPKALVLSHVRSLLNSLEYGKAVVATRKYRIDMNIIFDHNPEAFLKNAKRFVEDVNNPDHINLFVSTLTNEDITKTKFAGYHSDGKILKNHHETSTPQASSSSSSVGESKINKICTCLRAALNEVDKKKYISSILTTYAKNEPPMLEDALQLIRSLRTSDKPIKNSDSDAALSYLVFLIDVNTLYDIALGMYDFDLVLMVAQKSQKDPKEYLPFLANLKKLEQYYRQYSIDMYLNRFEKALENISKAGPEHFHEAVSLIREKGLFKLGMKLYENDKEKLEVIFEAYGDYLVSTGNHKQAGFAYVKCKKFEKAQEAFIEAGEYQYVFSLTKPLGQSAQDIKKIAKSTISVLERGKNSIAASLVCRDYLNDHEEAVLKLVSGHEWKEAVRVATCAGRNDLIDSHVKPGVFESAREITEDLIENETKLTKYIARLKELREEKEAILREQLLMQQHNEGEFGEDMPHNIDALSEASSMQSGVSGYSGVSVLSSRSTASSVISKRGVSRKKKNREKLKKGSPFEEGSLVSRIESLIPSKNFIASISSLLEILIYFEKFEEAKILQNHLEVLINLCEENREIIEEPFQPPQIENEPAPPMKYPRKVHEIIGDWKKESWKLALLE